MRRCSPSISHACGSSHRSHSVTWAQPRPGPRESQRPAALCLLTSSGAFSTRRLFTDQGEISFAASGAPRSPPIPIPLLRRLYWAPALGRALHHAIGKFDIVHLHAVFLWPTWAAARAARSAGVPYVLSPRGMLVKDLIARRSRLAKSAWIHLIERSNVEQAAALHLTSELERTELECFGWQLPRLSVIPNAIDEPISPTGKIASDVEALTLEQPLVLFLGRLSWKKRPRSAPTRVRPYAIRNTSCHGPR